MSERVYQLVRDFLRDGPPTSRNLAFEAYQDPRFARAARIYQFLASVRDDLGALLRAGEPVSLHCCAKDERVAWVLTYGRARIRRTAYMGREEWQLVQEDPAFAQLLRQVDVRRGDLPPLDEPRPPLDEPRALLDKRGCVVDEGSDADPS